ncbi:MAG: hbpA 1 [Rhizobiaceae bacterium]|nr:hbpA 1 [Rhizobiaceae bacterium]
MTVTGSRLPQTICLPRREVLKGGAGLAGLLMLGTAPARAQGTPVSGGTLRIAQGTDAQPKNALAGRAGNNSWRHNVFDTLTVLDSTTGEPRPILATEWSSSEDGKSFVIRLREGVTFHSGRPFTAEDVVFTLEQVKVPENASQMRPIVMGYTSVEATGTHEVTITSDKPVAPRIFDVFQLAVILDKDTMSGLADGSKVIGTGPYRWADWVPGASFRLERNDAYWGEKPHLDAVDVSVITDPTAMANAVRGRADLVLAMTPRDAAMFSGDPSIELFQSPGGQIFPLGLNVTAPPFDKKEVRHAVGFAIDRQRIVDQLFNGVGDGSPLWWPSNVPGMTDAHTSYYKYDPERARKMIADAGAAGAEVEMTVIGLAPVPALYEIVQNNLREVGLAPTGGVVETAAFDQRQLAGDLGPAFMQIHGLQGFSAATLADALPALRDENPSKFNPPEYRQLKDKVQAATGDDYAAAMRELAEFMLDAAFSHILVHTYPLNAKSARVQGLVYDNVGYLHLSGAWIGA